VALLVLASLVGPFAGSIPPVATVELPRIPEVIRVRLKAIGEGPWTLNAPAHIGAPEGQILHTGTTITHDGSNLLIDGASPATSITLFPTNLQQITLNNRPYPGHCTIHHREDFDDPVVIAHVKTEVYVSHVLPAEMPLHYPDSALRAQAIAIRTYGLWQAQRRHDRLWDVMGGMSTPASVAPVKATNRQVLLFNDALLPAYYSAICGGATRSNQEAFGAEELPPLSGVSCDYCRWTRTRKWSVRVSTEQLKSTLELDGPVLGVRLKSVGNSGYDSDILIETPSGEKSFSTSDFRRQLSGGLKSSWIEKINLSGSTVKIQGLGYGHGVGLCQTGSRRLAQLGRNYVEVLTFYYPGARLIRLEM
jgi:stage II sporulation protein D